MNWDDLRVLLAVSRERTVLGAARALGVSRSTVNRRLDTLEQSAGVGLVERTPDGIALTAAGAQAIPLAERIEEEALAAERLLAGRDFTISGCLDVTVFEVAAALLTPVFVGLRAAHPEIELRIAVTNRSLSLRRRECDLAIRATNQPGTDLFGRKLGRLRYAVYGRPEVVRQGNPPWILWHEEVGAEGTWSLARQVADPLRVAALVDSAQLMLELACAGAGVALLPMAQARRCQELAPMGEAPAPGMGIDAWLLTHPDLRRAARVRTAMRFMTEQVGRRRPFGPFDSAAFPSESAVD